MKSKHARETLTVIAKVVDVKHRGNKLRLQLSIQDSTHGINPYFMTIDPLASVITEGNVIVAASSLRNKDRIKVVIDVHDRKSEPRLA